MTEMGGLSNYSDVCMWKDCIENVNKSMNGLCLRLYTVYLII